MADSFNELFGLGTHSEDANLEGCWTCQDNAASTAVDDVSANNYNGTLQGGDNTADITTTGPNSWLPAALDLDGTNDYISMSGTGLDIAGNVSVIAWVSLDVLTTDQHILGAYNQSSPFSGYGLRNAGSFGVSAQFWTGSAWSQSSTNMFAAATWVCVGASNDNTTTRFYKNGAAHGTAAQANPASYTGSKAIGARRDGGVKVNGKIAGMAIFSRQLTDAEFVQVNAGPEPVNSVAPAISGTETEGETLSVTTGTWGLDAPFSGGTNGTITYAYQWTRSNDAGGTGEADIGSATSNTYTLQAADVGKFIRCRVAASNDGGNDADADTNSDMSGAIAAAGGGGTILPPIRERRTTMKSRGRRQTIMKM